MKKIFTYSIIIIVFIVLADFLVGKIGNHLIEKLSYYGDNLITKPNFALNKAKADILILGSSRAEHHYNTKILQQKFPSYAIYNAGQHNQGMNYALAVLQSCMQRQKPKIVILDCEYEVLSDPNTYTNNTLKPFYNTNNNVKSVLNRNLKDKILLKSNFYKFNSIILKLYLDTKLPNTQDTLMGFDALNGNLDTNKVKYKEQIYNSLIDAAVKDLNTIISLCKENNIKLYAVISPYYYHQNEKAVQYMELKKIFNYNKIPCFDYINDSFFDCSYQLFYDINHLNEKGAEIFTKQLLKDIAFY